jgi:hypothetical protein
MAPRSGRYSADWLGSNIILVGNLGKRRLLDLCVFSIFAARAIFPSYDVSHLLSIQRSYVAAAQTEA